MKKTFILLSLLFINSLFADNIFEIKLNENEKLENTYTAEISNGNTIHFTLIKNSSSKNYFLTPYLVDNNKHVKKLESYVSNNLFNIISYHLNNNVATIVDYDNEKKELHLIDFDLNSGKHKSSTQELKEAPDNIFRLKSKTLFVSFNKKLHQLNVKSILDLDNIQQTQITIPKEKIKLFNSLMEGNPESINQEEFVKNGSISKSKGYCFDDNLIYTLEKDAGETQIFHFNLKDSDNFETTSIKSNFKKETKDISNYFYDNKIVFMGVEKQDIKLNIFDVNSSATIKEISFSNDLSNLIKTDLLNDYIKTALKSSIKSTITINKTKNNKLIFRLDNVKAAEYSYNYNWWFHQWFFQQQMIQQQMMQQMMRSVPRGFGPSPNDYFFDNNVTLSNENYTSIEVIFDLDFKGITNENQETIYPKIDKEKYLDKYKDDRIIKKFSSGFTDDEARFMYQNLKSKTIIISYEKL